MKLSAYLAYRFSGIDDKVAELQTKINKLKEQKTYLHAVRRTLSNDVEFGQRGSNPTSDVSLMRLAQISRCLLAMEQDRLKWEQELEDLAPYL